ncbi:MAG: sialate O-acetylesterase [Bacteroidetes bacterium]|nr:sialate O-acetylesterase [Bacteroidota bacterium]MBU1680472.1 sialate O-acetylesterase [Bacteroidota bacterium]MBU2505875.1 sialate O-acetylesterase [Bacteroidota bacterium]
MNRFVIILLFISSAVIIAQENKFGTYYNQRKTLFESLPDDKNEIIFLGNSITDGCNWSELFPDKKIRNRGISGDVTEGILFRLNEITASKPDKIFLMIGVNDLAIGLTPDSLLINYRKILQTVKRETPKTKLFVQSVLPVNEGFGKFANHVTKSNSVLIVNEGLQKLAHEMNYSYLDLYSSFADENGVLKPEFTNDGLHLTGAGYMLWKSLIEKYVYD